jgi:precorrin-6B C5,15-methyltransferase / cobalt-precorrin-6B C5,C15-methyltransferase
MTAWLTIVGIGDDGPAGLAPAMRALIDSAEVIVGGARHLAMIPESAAERLPWRQPFAGSIAAIAARRGRRVVVLASGDPMWFGAGAVLVRHFPPEEIAILPHPGAFSLAAARLGWPIADCALLSLHARPLGTLRLHLAEGCRILILSEDGGTPRAVAQLLTESGWGPSRLTVLEHLGGAAERAAETAAQDWADREAADLNTIALECRGTPGVRGLPRLAGLPDDAFEHDGQLTKREIRAATLAALAPLWGESLWDVGAGCGSVAIEWLRAGENLSAVAIERDLARVAMIARNAAALGVPELRIVNGAAPQALAGLTIPDAIFVGGGIAEPDLLPALWQALRPGGRLVANVISVEGERAVLEGQARHGGSLTRLTASRAESLGSRHAWRPLIAVTQWLAVKPG